MAYADPQSITISGSAVSLPRVGSGPTTGAFSANDGTVQLSVLHTSGKRNRHTLRLTHSKIAPDPLISAQNIRYSASVYLGFDVPPTGYTVAELVAIVTGFLANATASSNANITKLLGGEN